MKKIVIGVMVFFMFLVEVKADDFQIDHFELFMEHGSVMLIIDPENGDIVFANHAAEDFYGYSIDELLTMKISHFNMLSIDEVQQEMNRAREEERNFFNFKHRIGNGEVKDVEVYSYPYESEGGHVYLFSIIYDVTEQMAAEKAAAELQRNYFIVLISILSIQVIVIVFLYIQRERNKRLQKELSYIAHHDSLTDLINRNLVYDEFRKIFTEDNLGLAFYMIDINNLKLINDTFGHLAGDEVLVDAANALNALHWEDKIVSRISGDEFVVVAYNISNEDANFIKNNIREIEVHCENMTVALAVGMYYCNDINHNYNEIFELAENEMYVYKVGKKTMDRQSTVDALMKTLSVKNKDTEDHCRRVSEYAKVFGQEMGLDVEDIETLVNTAFMHDIGKVALDLAILNKPGKLTTEEMDEIKLHPEKGYIILSNLSTSNTLPEAILYHHERFDGTGYPFGIKDVEIPLFARMITICDAFDAMTSYRHYLPVFNFDEAITEMLNCSGTQFDPELVQTFISADIRKVYEDNKKRD